MKRTTFVFHSAKSYRKVYMALLDTMYTFYSDEDKKITVYGEAAINDVRNACKQKRLVFDEI